MEGLTDSLVLWRGGGAGGSVLSGYPPAKCENLVAKPKNAAVELTWTDPEDIAIAGSVTVKWGYTKIVRKVGSYPEDENDGATVVTSSVRNQYQSSPYTDSGLTNNTTYYYAAFACSEDGVFNKELVTATVMPVPYKIMTVQINLGNSNPASCGSYADDAISMSSGKDVSAWAEFFGYKPCLFKDGVVVGYLNPNNYTKFEDGTSADITSGNAGDVMVEFPRRGLKLSKSGSVITVSMTDDPNNSNFSYNAHRRGNTQKDYFYVGAYLGYNSSSKLRSLSGKTPTVSITLSNCRTYAGNLGSGYMNVGFYQFLFMQCMYVLQYKGNLNSQTAHGYGYCYASSKTSTGDANTKGMMYGSTSSTDHVKLFGIEDFWGNILWWLDGYHINGSYHILTATDGFNDSGSGYTDNGTLAGTSSNGGYYNNATGTTETGFTPMAFHGSSSTYFCDYGYFDSTNVPVVGGDWGSRDNAGVFRFNVNNSPAYTNSSIGGRLGYL